MNIIPALKMGAMKVTGFLAKESPSILTGLSVAGVFTTAILSINATPKALILIETEKRETGNTTLTKLEIVKIVWKCYIPPALVAFITAACIIGANSINHRRNAALASIYTITENALREYQKKVIDVIGENKEEKIRDEIAQDRLDNDPLCRKEVIVTGRGETLFYDALSGRYFKSDMESIRRLQNDFNWSILNHEMYKPLNDFYEHLGLEGTEVGRIMGWTIDSGNLDIKFSAKIADGQPCIVLDYKTFPVKL